MKSNLLVRVVTVFPLSLALVFSFSGTTKTHSGTAEASEAQKSGLDVPARGKTAAESDLSPYEKVMLLPAELDAKEDSKFEGVTVPGRLAMAAYLTESVAGVLREKGLLAEKPKPGVAQLRLVLNGLVMTRKGASAAPPAPPFPLPDLPLPNSPATGTASVTAKVIDSETGETITSFITRETAKGNLMNALPMAIDIVARSIGDRLEQSSRVKSGQESSE